ncbi:MAG TPA: hypothetical protein VFI44_05350, partial [Ornithinibacter sp.]|nr:hypothetical protein [Ornithinibacter sp.]
MGNGEAATARRATASVLVTGCMVLALGACGADVERVEAGRAADAFARAGDDTRAACDRLAPRTLEALEQDGASCPQALALAGLPDARERREVTVAGHSA